MKSIITCASCGFFILLSVVTLAGCIDTMELKYWQETWNGHSKNVTLVYQDADVAIYSDENVNIKINITWTFDVISRGWKYVKETYGLASPDPILYVVLHADKYKGCFAYSYRSTSPVSRNQIDCGDAGPVGATPRQPFLLDTLIEFLARIIPMNGEYSALKNMNSRIGERGMIALLRYDLQLFLKGPTEFLISWKEEELDHSQNGTYWFRDWLLPIYEQFGGTSVLRDFINLSNCNSWPAKPLNVCPKIINLGEFVHFWSGAAQQDLYYMAKISISNSEDIDVELVAARNDFPLIYYPRGNCELEGGVIRCATRWTCVFIAWTCNGKEDCSDGLDEYNCAKCKSNAFKCAHGRCVERNKVCDFKSDCGLWDGSDESNCTDAWNPISWTRSWSNPQTRLQRVYLDENVAVYFESGMNASSLWIYHVSQVYSAAWAHVKSTYGLFGKNPRLAVVFHSNNGAEKDCQTFSSGSANTAFRNLIDCGKKAWGRNGFLDFKLVLIKLTLIIRTEAERNTNNKSIDAKVSRNNMDFIIFYDLYVQLKASSVTELSRWKELTSNTTWNGVYFFRDWYLPIYDNYGGFTALGKFYNLVRSQKEKLQKERKFLTYLNIGEFVHFWSGAAGADLLPIALQIFNSPSSFMLELMEAKKNFPSIIYTTSQCRREQFRCRQDRICVPQGWRCNGKPECADGSDEANCIEVGFETSTNVPDTSNVVPIVVGILFLMLLTALVGVGWKILSYRRKIHKLQEIRGLTDAEVNDFLEGNVNLNASTAHVIIYSQPFISDFEIPRKQLVIDDTRVLGSGEFGIVKKGVLLKDQDNTRSTGVTVAVKMVKPNAKVEHFKAFLEEIKIMAFLGKHKNVASLLGSVTGNIRNCEVFVALEFCSNGDLLRCLRASCDHFQDVFSPQVQTVTSVVFASGENKDLNSEVTFVTSVVPKAETDASFSTQNLPISTLDLLDWSRQIADGMNYLTFKKVIHGDLAARNVLLTGNKTAKISDFGLSHQLINYEIYRKASESPLPWRWLAIESLCRRTFSMHSDVWAFGVTLWEIFTLGEVPFSERRWDRKFINDLANGMRPNSPQFGNEEIYNLMISCMEIVPSERIMFSEISLELQRIKESLICNLPSTLQGGSSCIYSVLE